MRITVHCLAWISFTGPLWAQPDGPVDFDREIRPILSDNCFRCHGPDNNARKAGLRLDTPEGALNPAKSGQPAVVPGNPAASALVSRISSSDPNYLMPPPHTKMKLTDAERNKLVDWIAAGAEYENHWAFQPIVSPPLPRLKKPQWARNAIDYFVLSRLEREGLEPSPEAQPHQLIRRLYLDLLGMPPNPGRVNSYVGHPSVAAYERLVDEILSSPQFGERMAWEWLDAARYADSNGYQGDRDRTMWPWRDWVVAAFNRGLSYREFTIWQLAGDLIADRSPEQHLATGFCRNHMINGEGGRIPDENRVDYVIDMTETMGTVWLGLTLTCCRCHDHKYDPLSKKDYYSLFAFFNQTPVNGGGGDPQTAPSILVPSSSQAAELSELKIAEADFTSNIESLERELDSSDRLSDSLRKLISKPPANRDTKELEQLEKLLHDKAPNLAGLLGKYRNTRQKRQQLEKAIPRVMVMEDLENPRSTHMLDKGLYNKPQQQVAAALPELFQAAAQRPSDRLGLANWLFDRGNPLTARVTVNRIWQQLFGLGLVKTSEDFGTQGSRPSHPELLDWLASEFRQSDWDLKGLLRLIVTSQTYRQSSAMRPLLAERDPTNRLLARSSRYRLPSWMIRDQALALSGLLDRSLGGRPVHPYQPAGVWAEATFGKKKYQIDSGKLLYRRSLYTFWRRIIAPTMFFDSASRQTCTVKQGRTNTPLHALVTLNDVTYVEAARVMAQELLRRDPGGSVRQRVAQLIRQVLCRSPSREEAQVLVSSVHRLRTHYADHPDEAKALATAGEYETFDDLDFVELACWTALCNLILNLDEALTRE